MDMRDSMSPLGTLIRFDTHTDPITKDGKIAITYTRFRNGQQAGSIVDEVTLINGLTDPLVKIIPKVPDLRMGDYVELAWHIIYDDGEQTSITREMFDYGGFTQSYTRQ